MLSKIKKTTSEIGPKNTFFYLFHRLLSSISSERIKLLIINIALQPITETPSIPIKFGRNIDVAEISANDAVINQFPRPKHVTLQRFSSGAKCFVAYNKGEFAGYIWCTSKTFKENDIRCDYTPYPDNLVTWDFDLYIEPKYRLGFVFAKLWNEVNINLHSKGIKATLSRINGFNGASLRSHKKLGAQIIAEQLVLKLFSFQLIASSIRPYMSISITDKSRTRFILDYNELQQR